MVLDWGAEAVELDWVAEAIGTNNSLNSIDDAAKPSGCRLTSLPDSVQFTPEQQKGLP